MRQVYGTQKVTGGKLYARDLYPPDRGMGATWLTAICYRTNEVGKTFAGFHPERLQVTPSQVLLRDASNNAQTKVLDMLALGEPVRMSGQLVAILYYDSPGQARAAARELSEGDHFASFTGALEGNEQDVRRILDPLLGARQLTAGREQASSHFVIDTKGDAVVFSYSNNGAHNPTLTKEPDKSVNRSAREVADRLAVEMSAEPGLSREHVFFTQTTDPMFMEPEAGMALFEKSPNRIKIVAGTQSPSDDIEGIRSALSNPEIDFECTPPGGGFGGRDKSPFPLILAIAAWAVPGTAVRMAYSREEQFLTGIKRHAAAIQARVRCDAEGILTGLRVTGYFNGGGQDNLTFAVVGLAALHAGGMYRQKKAAVSITGVTTAGAPAGSMRGFGIPQVTLAIESLVDELAVARGDDPIAFRIRNAVIQGERDIAGSRLVHHIANVALCRKAAEHPMWKDRADWKQKMDRDTVKYGVGFGGCMEAYGTSSDAVFAEVEIDPSGAIVIRSTAIDMGQGSATAIALEVSRRLGQENAEVELGSILLFEKRLKMKKLSGSDTGPRFTKKITNSMSASITVFFHLQAVAEACAVILRHGVLPAAERIWGVPAAGAEWIDGQLQLAGYQPIPWGRLVAEMASGADVMGASVHTYFQIDFAKATFNISTGTETLPIDGLAIRRGGQGWTLLDRTEVKWPETGPNPPRRSLYASAGHLVQVAVYVKTGAIEVLDAVPLLDAGDVHHPDLLGGQVEGGLAMGIGMALLEDLPQGPNGWDGRWNLHRYTVAKAANVPLETMGRNLVLIPLETGGVLAGESKSRKKGIAEATMTTVPAAIHNAIAHAIGVRIYQLPFTPQRVVAALEGR